MAHSQYGSRIFYPQMPEPLTECDLASMFTVSPQGLRTTHTAPELEFLQAKWAAHVSFAAVADLLHDVLPVNACVNRETIRAQVFETAERLESELVCRPMVESTAIEPSGDRNLLRLQAATAIGISTKGVKTLRITVLLRKTRSKFERRDHCNEHVGQLERWMFSE